MRGLSSREVHDEVLRYNSISEIENFVNRRLQLNYFDENNPAKMDDQPSSKFEIDIN
jgi:hypothetical protein